MNFFKRITTIFGKRATANGKQLVGEESCPFCWGYQTYDQKIRMMPKEKQIDVKNHKDKYVKVGKFMVEHVDGFKNKRRIVERCPKCGGKHIKYIENP